MFRELHEEVGLKPEHVRIIARTRDWLRYEVPDALHPPRRARPLQGPEADLVPAAADRPRQRHEPARDRPSGVRRLALERVLGAARRRDRVQARRLPDGADRAGALPAARRPSQPLPALGHAAAPSRRDARSVPPLGAAPLDEDHRLRRRSSRRRALPRRRRSVACTSAATRSPSAAARLTTTRGCRGGSARARRRSRAAPRSPPTACARSAAPRRRV